VRSGGGGVAIRRVARRHGAGGGPRSRRSGPRARWCAPALAVLRRRQGENRLVVRMAYKPLWRPRRPSPRWSGEVEGDEQGGVGPRLEVAGAGRLVLVQHQPPAEGVLVAGRVDQPSCRGVSPAARPDRDGGRTTEIADCIRARVRKDVRDGRGRRRREPDLDRVRVARPPAGGRDVTEGDGVVDQRRNQRWRDGDGDGEGAGVTSSSIRNPTRARAARSLVCSRSRPARVWPRRRRWPRRCRRRRGRPVPVAR